MVAIASAAVTAMKTIDMPVSPCRLLGERRRCVADLRRTGERAACAAAGMSRAPRASPRTPESARRTRTRPWRAAPARAAWCTTGCPPRARADVAQPRRRRGIARSGRGPDVKAHGADHAHGRRWTIARRRKADARRGDATRKRIAPPRPRSGARRARARKPAHELAAAGALPMPGRAPRRNRHPRWRLLLVSRRRVPRPARASQRSNRAMPAASGRSDATRRSARGDSGHAEVVRVTFDPAVLSFARPAARLLHHPRPDDARPPGQRRRHAIPVGDLLRDAGAARDAEAVIAELAAEKLWPRSDRDRDRRVRRRSIRRRPTTRTISSATAASRTARRRRAEGRQVPQGVRASGCRRRAVTDASQRPRRAARA